MVTRAQRIRRRAFIRGALEAGGGFAGLGTLGSGPRSFGASATDGLVVLTFDDAVKTHRATVAPLPKELGFGATFFVTHRWMAEDPAHYLTWREIGEIHQMGFEIGNHSWTHADFSIPKNAARLAAELALVENELRQVGVPRPISFAWCGNQFGPEAIQQLSELGCEFGRRGMQPEIPYGKTELGPTFDPEIHHRLLIPSTGDAYPGWTLAHFQRVVDPARHGKIVVLQFHGVPDPHPWVNTPPERFREYMDYLKLNEFQVVAVRDLRKYLTNQRVPNDRLLEARYSGAKNVGLELPTEMKATRGDLSYWLKNMLHDHHYTWQEAAAVTGLGIEELKSRASTVGSNRTVETQVIADRRIVRVLPYPGGRHPRSGFLEGAILPQRGTKASIFLPWDPASYIVIDLPEAIFSNLGLTFLAHTHIPTIWDKRNLWLENIDWERRSVTSLTRTQRLPNKIAFGASIQQSASRVELELWLRNDTAVPLHGLRTQICLMLKGAHGFNAPTNENKVFRIPTAAVRSAQGDRWILMAWDRCGRAWGNAPVPCLHADPVLPDCPPGQTVRVRGRIWFHEGGPIERELEQARTSFAASLG
jgi:peptidoglycan/xylan/chitin deacetylase (PgdA/CDA1 family)